MEKAVTRSFYYKWDSFLARGGRPAEEAILGKAATRGAARYSLLRLLSLRVLDRHTDVGGALLVFRASLYADSGGPGEGVQREAASVALATRNTLASDGIDALRVGLGAGGGGTDGRKNRVRRAEILLADRAVWARIHAGLIYRVAARERVAAVLDAALIGLAALAAGAANVADIAHACPITKPCTLRRADAFASTGIAAVVARAGNTRALTGRCRRWHASARNADVGVWALLHTGASIAALACGAGW